MGTCVSIARFKSPAWASAGIFLSLDQGVIRGDKPASPKRPASTKIAPDPGIQGAIFVLTGATYPHKFASEDEQKRCVEQSPAAHALSC